MKYKLLIIAGALGVTGAAAAGARYLAYPVQVSMLGGLTHNYLASWSAPPGTITTESNAAYKAPRAVASSPGAEVPSPNTVAGDWPSYNNGLVYVGNAGGNFYALNSINGEKLWAQDLGGAIGGGVITYTTNGAQKVAVAVGFTMLAWPTKIVKAKIVGGLDSASAKQ